MKLEEDPISDDEWLLRRVRADRFKNYGISKSAFEPRLTGRDVDFDGISLYRAACQHDPTDILATIPPEKWDENGIVRIPIAMLRSLGLSVQPKPDNRVKGHVVIPELNSGDYEADKGRFTEAKEMLALEASKAENIVRRPKSLTDG